MANGAAAVLRKCQGEVAFWTCGSVGIASATKRVWLSCSNALGNRRALVGLPSETLTLLFSGSLFHISARRLA